MTPKPKKSANSAVVLTIALLVIFAFIFLMAFIISSTTTIETPAVITENTYRAEVEQALEGADPSQAEALFVDHNCGVCHIQGNGTVAPLFDGIAIRAATRREPLGAEQYIYESIINPGAYVVEGYANAMPNNYSSVLTQDEIGHIIAYLMTFTTEPDES